MYKIAYSLVSCKATMLAGLVTVRAYFYDENFALSCFPAAAPLELIAGFFSPHKRAWDMHSHIEQHFQRRVHTYREDTQAS